MIKINKTEISDDNLNQSCQVLIKNGIDKDKAQEVLRAIGHTLLDADLYPDGKDGATVLEKEKFFELFNKDAISGKLVAVSPYTLYVMFGQHTEAVPIELCYKEIADKLGVKEVTSIHVDTDNDPVKIRIRYKK